MEIALVLFLSGYFRFSLIPDWPLSPDDEEVYEAIEDSLAGSGALKEPASPSYRLRWRVESDSPGGGLLQTGSFLYFLISQRNRSAGLILEKDPGENNCADFWGGGVSFWRRNWRFTAGDYLLHFGRGLIFAAPYARSGFTELEYSLAGSVFPRSALENRNLRGVRFDYIKNRYAVNLIGSYSMRDAWLNADGTVARLNFSGLHRDSAERSAKGRVSQLLGGAVLRVQLIPVCQAGMAVCAVRYNPGFAPVESVYSFYGDNLGQAGIYLVIGSETRRGEIEFARSFPGGMAGSIRVDVREEGFNFLLAGSVFGNRFFAPAGRQYGMSSRISRTDVSANAGYRLRRFWIRLRGNTHYDYRIDSIPGRAVLSAGYEAPPLVISIATGKIFRYEKERLRTTRVELVFNRRLWQLLLTSGDEYFESGKARGRFVGTNLRFKMNSWELGFSGAVSDITGSGISLSVVEPGAMRQGASYSFRKSGQRLSVAVSLKVAKFNRLGIKAGMTRIQVWEPDLSAQIELTN
ncbi:MAG: hypothetical protein ACPL0F_06650 [bacterium]